MPLVQRRTRRFYITGSYTLHEDGLAYRPDGPVYAAGFDPVDYDPAEDWGENWMNNWDKTMKKHICPMCGEPLKKRLHCVLLRL